MTLPLSRDLTYSNGTPVNPDNLNNLQDEAIARAADVRTEIISGLDGIPGDKDQDWEKAIGAPYAQGTHVTGWVIPLRLRLGSTIREIRAYVRDNLGVAVVMTLRTGSNSGAQADVATDSSPGAGGTDDTLVLPGLDEPVDGSKGYFLHFVPNPGGAAIRVYKVEIDLDNLAP